MKNIKLKEYSILEKLGQGSYGAVYLVKKRERTTSKNKFTSNTSCNTPSNQSTLNNNDSNNQYVLKQIPLYNMDKTEIEEVKQEAKILALLNCKYIVKYIDSFIESKTLNIIMEYCNGGDLSKYLKLRKTKPLKESEIWNIFIRIALGLFYLHSKKIIHRDLKSLNVFLNKDSTVKLGDLGVAKELSNTFANTFVGTPYYLSPEICEEKPYNEKSDMWSLGCLLYEMITFKHPFNASNQGALILKIIGGKYEPIPSTIVVSEELKFFIKVLLEKNPKKRYSSEMLFENNVVIQKLKSLNLYDDYLFLKNEDTTGKVVKEEVNHLQREINKSTSSSNIYKDPFKEAMGKYNSKDILSKVNIKDLSPNNINSNLFNNGNKNKDSKFEKFGFFNIIKSKAYNINSKNKDIDVSRDQRSSKNKDLNKPMIIKQKENADKLREKKKSFIGSSLNNIYSNFSNINQSNIASNVSLVDQVMGYGAIPNSKKISISNINFNVKKDKIDSSNIIRNIEEKNRKVQLEDEKEIKAGLDEQNPSPTKKRKKVSKFSSKNSFALDNVLKDINTIDEERTVIKSTSEVIVETKEKKKSALKKKASSKDKEISNNDRKNDIDNEETVKYSPSEESRFKLNINIKKSKSDINYKNMDLKDQDDKGEIQQTITKIDSSKLATPKIPSSKESSNINTNNNSVNTNKKKKKKKKQSKSTISKDLSKENKASQNNINSTDDIIQEYEEDYENNSLFKMTNKADIKGKETISKESIQANEDYDYLQTPKAKIKNKKGSKKSTIILKAPKLEIIEDNFESDIYYNYDKDSLEETRNSEDNKKKKKRKNKYQYYKEKFNVYSNSMMNIKPSFAGNMIFKNNKFLSKKSLGSMNLIKNNTVSFYNKENLELTNVNVLKINNDVDDQENESSNFSDRSDLDNEIIVTQYLNKESHHYHHHEVIIEEKGEESTIKLNESEINYSYHNHNIQYKSLNNNKDTNKYDEGSTFLTNTTHNSNNFTDYKIADSQYPNGYLSSQLDSIKQNSALENNLNKIKDENHKCNIIDKLKLILGENEYSELNNYYQYNKYSDNIINKCENYINIRFKKKIKEEERGGIKELLQKLIIADIYIDIKNK